MAKYILSFALILLNVMAVSDLLKEYDGLTLDAKESMCEEIEGIMFKGTCYTFDQEILGITEVVEDGEDIKELINMKDCPGGCAIWGVTCAPSTYKELCEHAKNQGRDVMRKYVFYIFLGVFAMGTMYICCSSDDNA